MKKAAQGIPPIPVFLIGIRIGDPIKLLYIWCGCGGWGCKSCRGLGRGCAYVYLLKPRKLNIHGL